MFMSETPRRIEILKQSAPLSGQTVLTMGAVTNVEDITVHQTVHGSEKPWLWLILAESPSVLHSAQDLIIDSKDYMESAAPDYAPNLSRLLDTHQLPYQNTVFVGYKMPLGEHRNTYSSLNNSRTVWIPAIGFLNGEWHDGPLVVIESDGTISSMIPTGTQASLLLAPDGSTAIGKDQKTALALGGTRHHQLFRGCVAATQNIFLPISDEIAPTKDGICFTANDQSLRSMVQLAILRASLPPKQAVFIQLKGLQTSQKQQKVEPRFRRFCEHTGIAVNTWLEPIADLDQLFQWLHPDWISDLNSVINEHGSVIPG